MINPELEAKISQKQKERREQFTKLKNVHILDDKAKSILLLPFKELQEKLSSREVSAMEVLSAYTAKALELNDKFNCVTEFIPQAGEWAATLDKEPITSQDSGNRPLRGLPVAIKEDHDVEGMDTTLGYAKNLYKPAKESSVLVKILVKLGAVPFVKTNVPQSLDSSGSDNPIFGTTLNSLNPEMGPGGSSSGSGCIVAAGGAAFATGSDLLGSLRIPSHFHGICTLRPTANRLSDKGLVQCLPELSLPFGVPGIISKDAETLSFIWKALTENNIQSSFDPMAVPIPWNENLFASTHKLKIGYFTSLPLFPAFDSTIKTVLAAKDAFQSLGHSLVEFQMPDDFHYYKVISELLAGDQGAYLEKIFEGEPISPCVAGMVEALRKSRSSTSSTTLEKTTESGKSIMTRREQLMGGHVDPVTTSGELWDLLNEKRLITQDILGKMEKAGIDLILSPAFPFPAVKLHHVYRLSGSVYTGIWNFVNFPAGVVRFGTESGGNDSYDDENDPYLKFAKEAMSDSAGMPINIQIIGRPFKEELVLRAMVELEKMWMASNIQE